MPVGYYMEKVAYECTVNRREELLHQIFDPARWINEHDVLCKVTHLL
jgi:hypothetical protein